MSTTSLDRGRMIPIHPGRRAASDADRGPRPLAAAAVVVLLAGAFLSLGCRPGAAPDFAAAPPELVELAVAAPDIILDIKYATTDNFTGKAVYPIARCFLVKEAAQALVQVQADLRTFGYGLKVFDGYRPLSVQNLLVDSPRRAVRGRSGQGIAPQPRLRRRSHPRRRRRPRGPHADAVR